MRGTHPDIEQLAAYLYAPNDGGNAWMHTHVNGCEECRQELDRLGRVIVNLKTGAPVQQDQDGHAQVHELLGYINGTLKPGGQEQLQQHLDSCGSCMKRLMLMRSRLNEYGAVAAKDSVMADSSQIRPATAEKPSWLEKAADWFTQPASLALVTVSFMVFVSAYVMLDLLSLRDQDLVPASMPPDQVVNVQSEDRRIPGVRDAGPLVKVNNAVNWYQGYIETTAFGTVDMSKMKNRVQAEIVAEKTARHLGYSQLVETIEGIRINSATIYKTMLMQVDDAEYLLDGFVRGASVVNRQVEWVDDVPRAQVTLRLPLFGREGLQGIMHRQMPGGFGKPVIGSVYPPVVPETGNASDKYTSVIIDASGVDYEPALYCSVMSKNNEKVFSGMAGTGESSGYFADIDSARKSVSAGQSPFVIKAAHVNKTGEIIIGQEDAAVMQKTLSRGGAGGQLLVVF